MINPTIIFPFICPSKLPLLKALTMSNNVVIINEYPPEFPDSGHQPADGTVEKYALVIGVSDYEDLWAPDLQFTDDDALAWKEYLESIGYQVILLTGYVRASDVERAVYDLLLMEDADDYVAFIFSGHGSFLGLWGIGLYSAIALSDFSFLTQNYFADAFSRADSNHIFFFFDACQIGGMEILASSAGRLVAMASDKTHYSYEDPELKHGVFTYYFLIDAIENQYKVFMEDAFYEAKEKCLRWNQMYNVEMNPILADGNPNSYFVLFEIGTASAVNLPGYINYAYTIC